MSRTALPLCLIALAMSMGSCASSSQQPQEAWLEPDSATAIHERLLRDFPMTLDEATAALIEKYPQLTADSVLAYIDAGYIETMELDGQQRVFRKAVRNAGLLSPSLNGGWTNRGAGASDERISYVDSVLAYSDGTMPDGAAHKVHYRFSIDVPTVDALRGDSLRVWMPFPMETQRQSDIRLLSASPSAYIISEPEQSVHRTIYFTQPVSNDSVTHFEYEVEFITCGEYFAPDDIMARKKPYDKESETYRHYTAFDNRHIVRLDSLAKSIVGEETDPYKQSEMVYDYIISTYPWAGAREYSTIPCIPQYVIESGHGDCGQVALLYISLMRTLGVPARWESGWMLHPGELNLHDWAEVYFEGVGWVPVDVSFGRYTNASDPRAITFYSKGMDAHRLAANKGVGDRFYPPKRFLRSETVDSQLGEVECSKGNLFYPGWDQSFEIISVEPIEKPKK